MTPRDWTRRQTWLHRPRLSPRQRLLVRVTEAYLVLVGILLVARKAPALRHAAELGLIGCMFALGIVVSAGILYLRFSLTSDLRWYEKHKREEEEALRAREHLEANFTGSRKP